MFTGSREWITTPGRMLSYGLAATGIRAEPLGRWREALTPELADVISAQTWELYTAVSARADLREPIGSSHQQPEGTQ